MNNRQKGVRLHPRNSFPCYIIRETTDLYKDRVKSRNHIYKNHWLISMNVVSRWTTEIRRHHNIDFGVTCFLKCDLLLWCLGPTTWVISELSVQCKGLRGPFINETSSVYWRNEEEPLKGYKGIGKKKEERRTGKRRDPLLPIFYPFSTVCLSFRV